MKKHLAILFLAAGMLLGGAQQGQAVDFKAKGVWINMLEYGGGGNFVKRMSGMFFDFKRCGNLVP